MKKVAVVTGAASGIGQSTALVLAENGYIVYAGGRSEKRLGKTLEMAKGCDVRPLIFDARDPASAESAISRIDRIDCLVNGAGMSMKNKAIDEIEQADWDMIMETNARGYFFVTKFALRKMKRGASIVNISSGAAKTGGEFVSVPYSASKGAINSLTVSMARLLAVRGIRVNAVSPGFIDTDMLKLNGMSEEYYKEVIPLGILGKPIDIANMTLYLLSDKADFITGQIIEVNGGDIMG